MAFDQMCWRQVQDIKNNRRQCAHTYNQKVCVWTKITSDCMQKTKKKPTERKKGRGTEMMDQNDSDVFKLMNIFYRLFFGVTWQRDPSGKYGEKRQRCKVNDFGWQSGLFIFLWMQNSGMESGTFEWLSYHSRKAKKWLPIHPSTHARVRSKPYFADFFSVVVVAVKGDSLDGWHWQNLEHPYMDTNGTWQLNGRIKREKMMELNAGLSQL